MFANAIPIAPGLTPKDSFTRFAGGLDLETPAWTIAPGMLRDALNYEIAVEDGYQDIRGYERFDGQTAPSAAGFTILDVTITGSIEVNDTVTGEDTGATGYVVAKATYPDDAAQTYLVLTKVTGTFNDADENLVAGLVGGATEAMPPGYAPTGYAPTGYQPGGDVPGGAAVQGNTDAEGYSDSGPTSELTAQYKNLAADAYRADITTVPGEGDVWGVFALGALKYAIRNHTGGAVAKLFKSDAAGWTAVDLGYEVAFTSGGTYTIVEGDVITGASSGSDATVERVQVTSGTFAGGDAVGWLQLSARNGAFQSETLNVGAETNVCTIAADSAAITLQPDGRLDYDISNYADTQGPDRCYGADSVNLGWEFDGTVFAPIRTGMTDDTPDHVHIHKHQLFFSFDGSTQHSGLGNPRAWSVVLGANEIATGSPVTGFQVEPGAEGNAALLIACRQQIYILYGNDVSDWNLVRYREKVGAYEWTMQQVAYTLFLDDRGITDLRTTQAFGNFDHSSLTGAIRRLINSKKPDAMASCVVRDKNQYRLFFNDKTVIYVTMDGAKIKGAMPITLEDQVTSICSEEDPNGNEEIFFGSDNGYVYQMEKGTSFDGENIYAYLYTHFDHSKAIEWLKTYHAPVTLEGRSSGYAEFDLGYELDYADSDTAQPAGQTATMPAAEGSAWDSGLVWDSGIVWDDSSVTPTVGLDLRGEGRNISWIITKDSDYFEPLLLTGVHFGHIARERLTG